jgi:hypothetical protein
MSNRLKPEQFGGSNKQPKENYKPMRLDDVMQRSLAEVCKEWIGDGKPKEWTLKWMNDRFDLHGKMNLRRVCTDIEVEDKETGELKDENFCFQNGQVFSLDLIACAVFAQALADVLRKEDFSDVTEGMHHQSLMSFMSAMLEKYKHYVIWRMCYMTEDTYETMMFGCLLRDIGMDDGPQLSVGLPYPIVGSVLELLVKTGVLDYSGDMVS